MKKYALMLLCLFYSQNANAFCQTVTPYTMVETKTGTVRYQTHLSREEFLRKAPVKMSPNTLGMTVSSLGIQGSATPEVQYVFKNSYCVQIKEMRLTLGYDIIDVYIDKKYHPGSCEYDVVKEHENYHVRVSQEAMMFFKPDIEAALKKALAKLKPAYVSTEKDAQRSFERQFNQVMAELKPLITHINKKIAEKNYIIDTPQSYRETTALCRHW